MKPIYAAATAVALVAVFMLGMSISADSDNAIPAPSQAVVEPTETPLPSPIAAATSTPSPEATPQPPMVIYVQVPPQTIYVQVPVPATSEVAGAQAVAPSLAAPPVCHAAYAGVCLNADAVDYDCVGEGDGPQYTPGPFTVIGPDVFLLDSDRDGTACELAAASTPVVLVQTVVVEPTSTVTPTRTPRPTSTPVMTRGTAVVNFAGTPSNRPTASVGFAVQPGQNAWTAIQQAIGTNNLTFQDFGGSLGIFITGFYGVQAQGNHFWEFFVNGESSMVGVSGYIVRSGDVLEFRYSSF